MDILAIVNLVSKGITVAEALIEAGHDAAPAFSAIKNIITETKTGSVTPKKLDETEALLDSMVDDFNLDLPDA